MIVTYRLVLPTGTKALEIFIQPQIYGWELDQIFKDALVPFLIHTGMKRCFVVVG